MSRREYWGNLPFCPRGRFGTPSLEVTLKLKLNKTKLRKSLEKLRNRLFLSLSLEIFFSSSSPFEAWENSW